MRKLTQKDKKLLKEFDKLWEKTPTRKITVNTGRSKKIKVFGKVAFKGK